MTWNIAEGRNDGRNKLPYNSCIPALADEIRRVNTDVVLLNEAVNYAGPPFGNGMHQVKELKRLTGYPHAGWAHTTALGWTGHKVVAMLSRHPLSAFHYQPVPSPFPSYGMLFASTKIFGRHYRLVSLRFDAHNQGARKAGIRTLADAVRNSPGQAFIIGGDFNCGPILEPEYRQILVTGSSYALKDALLERPDPDWCGIGGDKPEPIDRILFRGAIPYERHPAVVRTEVTCPPPNVSDHPWVVAELEPRT